MIKPLFYHYLTDISISVFMILLLQSSEDISKFLVPICKFADC